MRLPRRRDDFWPHCDPIDRHNRFWEVELFSKVREKLVSSSEGHSTLRLPTGPFVVFRPHMTLPRRTDCVSSAVMAFGRSRNRAETGADLVRWLVTRSWLQLCQSRPGSSLRNLGPMWPQTRTDNQYLQYSGSRKPGLSRQPWTRPSSRVSSGPVSPDQVETRPYPNRDSVSSCWCDENGSYYDVFYSNLITSL